MPAAHAPTTPLRVLYIDHTAALGGGEIALLNLVRALDRRRVDPEVLLFDDGPLGDELRGAGVRVHVLRLDGDLANVRKDSLGPRSLLRAVDVARLARFAATVTSFIRRGGYDLIHTNSLKADLIGGVAGRLAGRFVVWHVRDRIAPDYLPEAVVVTFRALCRVLPNYVIANSHATLHTLGLPGARGSQRWSTVHDGLPPPADWPLLRAAVVHSGLQPNAFRSGTRPLGLSGDPPLIGIVGRLSRWKGQHVFLRAAALVRARFPNARFQVIGSALFGEAEYEAEIRALTTSLGLDGAVEFTGFRTDVPKLIERLDVLVHASITGEPFGQVVVEGMAAGRPVVATDGGGVPEIVVDGQTGYLVPMNDPHAMGLAVCKLLDDPELARRMGAAGQERARSHFGIGRVASQIHALYDSLVRRPPVVQVSPFGVAGRAKLLRWFR